jgi:hypothetical protein
LPGWRGEPLTSPVIKTSSPFFVRIAAADFIASLSMPSLIPTASDDATAVITDLYDMVAAEVKAAASACPASESSPFYNPVIYREVPDGMNARGELLDCFLLFAGIKLSNHNLYYFVMIAHFCGCCSSCCKGLWLVRQAYRKV